MPDPTGDLTSYAELAKVLDLLPVLVREARRARRLSARAAGVELGVSFATVSRVESGEDCVLSTAIRVLRWLDRPVAIGPPDPPMELRKDDLGMYGAPAGAGDLDLLAVDPQLKED